jgi:mRNA-degrading endonuclease RelE of RelBE toxin-antitoxin system
MVGPRPRVLLTPPLVLTLPVKLADMKIDGMFAPIRLPQANPFERCVKEIGTFCHIYCHEAHTKWPELLSHIKDWLNWTLSNSTGYSPVQLVFDSPTPDLFEDSLRKGLNKIYRPRACRRRYKAFIKMNEKASEMKSGEGLEKNYSSTWKLQVGDLVLFKCQAVSNAVDGITKKFVRPCDGF